MRLRTRLLLALTYVALLAVVALEIPLALSLRSRVDGEVRSQARGQAQLVAASAADLLSPRSRSSLSPLVASAGQSVRGRVIVVDARGRLIDDSVPGGRLGTDYSNRPEIRAALAGEPQQRVRYSRSLNANLLATAVPIVHDGRLAGAVRVTQNVAAVHAAVRRTIFELVLVGAAVLVFGVVAGALIAGQIARPLRRLEIAARRVADGDLEARAEEEGAAEQRSLAHSFNEMTSRLTAMIATQRRFVADASHQLRTPLTGLRLRLEAASAAWPRDRPSPDLDAATAEVDRLSQIVEELLDLSRAGEAATEPELCDLGAAAHAAAARFREPAQTRGVAVRVLDRGPAPGCCVEAELARVLDALLENALAYGAGGGDVEMTAAPGVIRVADRGPGPDPGDEELLFERFHRGRAARNGPPGTGLGLAISRALAQGWGGDVLLRAREGGGTVAVVTMPTHVAGPRPTEDSSRPVEVPA